MKMRTKVVIGRYNTNIGSVPGHSVGRRADAIPAGVTVDVWQDSCGAHVRWEPPGCDSYGNTVIDGWVGVAVSEWLESVGDCV